MRPFTSTFIKARSTSNSISRFGCALLVHYFNTVTGSLPNTVASHLPVCSVSARTVLMRFSFLEGRSYRFLT